MKRILICCDYMAPYEGNFISSIKKLDEALKKEYSIVYMFPKGENKDFLNWFKLFCCDHNVLIYQPFDYESIAKESSKDYDAIYLHFYSIEFARFLSKNNIDKKIILHGHHMPILKKWRAVVEFFKSFGKRYDNLYVIACSKGVQKSYKILVKQKNVFLSENCIDFNRLDCLSSSANIVKDNAEIIISMYGGEYYTKGVDLACRAIQLLSHQNIRLNVYCSHNLNENKKRIENDFPSLHSVNVMEYKTNPCEIYLNCTVFLAPSRFEGFNYSILECIYCGTPVIASNLKEHKHKCCKYIFFKKNSYKSLYKAISRFLSERPMIINKDIIRENHDLSIWVVKTKLALDRILKSKDI